MLDSFSSNVLKSLLGCCLMIICSSVGVRAMSSGYSGSPVSSVSWFPCFSFFQQACQNGPKWTKNAPNGRYHTPDFSLKNAKLRLNIIIIDILRAACVFIAFTFPQPCECVVFQNSDAKESFLPYKSSMIALSDMRRSNGVMNFKKSDADLFLYVLSMFLNAFYALLKATGAVYRWDLFLRGTNGGIVQGRAHSNTSPWTNTDD